MAPHEPDGPIYYVGDGIDYQEVKRHAERNYSNTGQVQRIKHKDGTMELFPCPHPYWAEEEDDDGNPFDVCGICGERRACDGEGHGA